MSEELKLFIVRAILGKITGGTHGTIDHVGARLAADDILSELTRTRPKTVGCGDVGKIAGEMEETLSEMQPCSCSKGHFMYGCRHSVVRLISLAKRLRSLAGEGE